MKRPSVPESERIYAVCEGGRGGPVRALRLCPEDVAEFRRTGSLLIDSWYVVRVIVQSWSLAHRVLRGLEKGRKGRQAELWGRPDTVNVADRLTGQTVAVSPANAKQLLRLKGFERVK